MNPRVLFPRVATLPCRSANGTVIGALSATDPEGDALTFSVVSSGGAPFVVLSNGSVMYLSPLGPLDYEGVNGFALVVTCREAATSDRFAAVANATVVVNLTNVNEPPYVLAASHHLSVPENLGVSGVDDSFAVTAAAVAVTIADPDAGDVPYVVLVPNAATEGSASFPFVLLPGGGVVVATRLRYWRAPWYALAVRVIDSFGLAVDDVVNVTVAHVNNRPAVTCGALGTACAVQYDENYVGNVDLAVTGADSDVGDVVTVGVVARSSALSFAITSAPGALAVMNVTGWIAPGAYWVVVQAVDSFGAASVAL